MNRPSNIEFDTYHLGIDLGSISIKVVLMDARDEIVFSRWERVAGRPLSALSTLLAECAATHPDLSIATIGVTGSGRGLIERALPSVITNEISAHAAAINAFHPEVRTIIEIGGQDSKLVIMEKGEGESARAIKDFRMNELCAAGTGAFLDQQASRLGMCIDEFARVADDAKDAASIAGRCAVFAKTDMTHHQQEGRTLPDIVAGLNDALARSYMANLVRGRELPGPIAFQGGVASNRSLVDTFRKILGKDTDLIVPRHHKVMGAIGAAIKGRSETKGEWPLELGSLEPMIRAYSSDEADGDTAALKSAKPLTRPRGKRLDPDFTKLGATGVYLGIDVGSVSVKLVLMGPDGIIDSDYRFSDGKPVDSLRGMLDDLCSRIDPDEVAGVGVTGSGRHFVGRLIGADAIRNEISAQALAASIICTDADTVFEIGGQDAKFMRVEGGHSTHFAMNKVCAAGTGAFLQEQAIRLEVDLDGEFAKAAFESLRPAELGARCTVFMESDLVSHQQMGFARNDLIAGLARSVVSNYMEKVVAGAAIGKRAVFLGGVAENEAIVAALEGETGMEISTSSAGKLSGAIGAAMAAMEELGGGRREKPFTSVDAKLEFKTHRCADCTMNCRISTTLAEPARHFGGRCGKWEGIVSQKLAPAESPIRQRLDALLDSKGNALSGGPRIGIPMALMAYDMLPAWRRFFEELGCEVVLSPPTCDEMLAEGLKHLVVETCLPVKAFCAHCFWLDGEGLDFIFVPSLVISGKDSHGKETSHCPYVQSLVQFARPIVDTPLLNPVINWKLDPNSETREMAKLAPLLGRSARDGREAWRIAREAQYGFRERLRSIGDGIVRSLEKDRGKRAFVLMGKDYNVGDERLSSGITSILESKGETVLTQDMLSDDGGNYSGAYRTMCWTHGKEILAAAGRTMDIPNLHPILVTSFGCGPDSFTIKFARDIMGERPFLILEVDEHTSPVGMETRIEAFLDSLSSTKAQRSLEPRAPFVPKEGIRRVFLPNFSDHGYAFAAALKTLGFEPVLTALPDDASARLGAKYSPHGECHPYVIMLGDYLKAASQNTDLSDACYFMPESSACRVGQFGTQMRLAAEEMGVDLPVFTRIQDLAATTKATPSISYLKVLTTYWEMMRGMDFFMQKHLETRAYECVPGSADSARGEAQKILMDSILTGDHLDGLAEASGILERVAVDHSKRKVRIGITGDYYTRICDYSNGDMFRDIERMGGVIMLPPTMSDFVKYESRQRVEAAARHGNAGDLALGTAIRCIVDSRERRVRKIAGSSLDYDIPLEYNRAKKLLAPYMDMRLPAGITGSVAATLEQIRAGADGIVSAITFHCTYGLAIGSVLSMIDRDHPDIPKLTLIFEGLKPTHNRLRLEAFMERVHDKASRRRGPC